MPNAELTRSSTKSNVRPEALESSAARPLLKAMSIGRLRRAFVVLATVSLLGCAAASGAPPGGRRATPGVCAPSWVAVATPNSGSGDNELAAASATSSTDMWAVGYFRDDAGVANTLAEHWDGTTWSVVSTPTVGGVSSFLTAVHSLASN